jgi:hypothetical protein
LLLELWKVRLRDYALRVKSVHGIGRVALGRECRICLDSDRLRQSFIAAIEEAKQGVRLESPFCLLLEALYLFPRLSLFFSRLSLLFQLTS